MNPRQRMLALRLTEKLTQKPEYAKSIGIEITNKKGCKGISNKSFAEQSVNYG